MINGGNIHSVTKGRNLRTIPWAAHSAPYPTSGFFNFISSVQGDQTVHPNQNKLDLSEANGMCGQPISQVLNHLPSLLSTIAT